VEVVVTETVEMEFRELLSRNENSPITVEFHTINGREYVTINGRTSRIYYNSRGYQYTTCRWRNSAIGVHRILMELKYGRRLKRWEHVHHIDGNRR
jgi:hypothetical protein